MYISYSIYRMSCKVLSPYSFMIMCTKNIYKNDDDRSEICLKMNAKACYSHTSNLCGHNVFSVEIPHL